VGFFRKLAFFEPSAKEHSQQHPVSVIICARDEAAKLVTHLPGALVQTYPTTHEVIVVNHNSQDDTRFLLDEFKKTFKGLHIVNLEHEALGIPGKKYPLSMGIKEALYEIVLLTDADCVPASEFWMQKMQDGYSNGIDVVLGYSPYRKNPGFLNKLIRFDTFHTAIQFPIWALGGIYHIRRISFSAIKDFHPSIIFPAETTTCSSTKSPIRTTQPLSLTRKPLRYPNPRKHSENG
jgi:glycosyltransferase involved in cell wall biosynthesis